MMRVLFIITSSNAGTWLSEVTHPYWHLSERGVAVDFASPNGGPITWAPWSDPTAEGSQEPDDLVSKGFLSDPELVARLKSTLKLSTVDLSQYDAMHIAGGGGAAVDLYPNRDVAAVLEHFYDEKKVVGVICHGAIALANNPDRVHGKRATGFTFAEDKEVEGVLGKGFIPRFPQPTMEAAGIRFESTAPHEVYVAIDGRLISGQNQQSASEYAIAFHHLLTGTNPVNVG